MTAGEQALQVARVAAAAAAGKLGTDIVALDVSEKLGIAEIFLIISAANERQVGAIVDAIEERCLASGFKPLRREGNREDPWVLLDFFDTVVHVQHVEARVLYSLDRLWKDCPVIDLGDGVPQPDSGEESPDSEHGMAEAASTSVPQEL